MALPINIEDLINGGTVEWERIEFKEGWNPLAVMHTIAAFANDFNNWGGGYIVIGISESEGRPILPPSGLQINQFDAIQKELVAIGHRIQPEYFPIAEPVEFQGKHILVIWVPGGQVRPYKAPVHLDPKLKEYDYYIRHFSSTKKATAEEAKELLTMSARVPYDDQINQKAEITDLSLSLIQNHLAQIGSDLLSQTETLKFSELCRKMNLVEGGDENIKPKNIGLLLFNSNPADFFTCAQIDLVQFKDDVGDQFSEKAFTGPIQRQLEDVLLYLKNNLITERVIKVTGQARAIRINNYPYDAIEEAIANTVYHRSYEDDSPIEIRIFPTYLEIISYPGPLPPLSRDKLLSGENFSARKYRNRRIGDFLKELHLTEGRGTGIPKIRRSMERNGSPAPIFDTDENLSYFLVRLEIHPDMAVQDSVQDAVQDAVQDVGAVEKAILTLCLRPKKRKEITAALNLPERYEAFANKIEPLLAKGYLERTIPDKPSSGNQQYRTTPLGQLFLEGKTPPEENLEQGTLEL